MQEFKSFYKETELVDIKYLPISQLKPYEKNPRKNDNAVDYVINSINEFGWRIPVVVDRDNVIVAGHTRYKAAKKLKIKEIPCIIADDLSEEQIKAFRLVDNKTQELASWDFGKLTDELNSLMEDFNIVPLGFEILTGDNVDDTGDSGTGEKADDRHDDVGEAEGSGQELDFGEELDLDEFEDEQFNCVCPFCGFKFNDD